MEQRIPVSKFASRRRQLERRDAANPSLEEVLDAVLAATWKSPRGAGYPAEIARVVDNVALYDLMALAANEKASDQVRAIASLKLDELKSWLAAPQQSTNDTAQRTHLFYAAGRIAQFQKDPKQLDLTPPSEPPDGPPIGADEDFENE